MTILERIVTGRLLKYVQRISLYAILAISLLMFILKPHTPELKSSGLVGGKDLIQTERSVDVSLDEKPELFLWDMSQDLSAQGLATQIPLGTSPVMIYSVQRYSIFPEVDPSLAYTQHLTNQTLAVLTTLSFDKYGVPVLTEHSLPIALTRELFLLLLVRQVSSLETLAVDILSWGHSFHVMDPRLSQIHWRKVYHTCFDDRRSHPKHFDCSRLSTLIAPVGALDDDLTRSFSSGSLSAIRDSASGSVNTRQLQQQHQQSSGSDADRTLVVYVYFESGQGSMDNLLFFLDHGVYTHAKVDYILVINGKSAIELPQYPNLQILRKNNSCFDIGSWGPVVLSRTGDYKHFVVINSSVRGPYLPQSWRFGRDFWYEAFTRRLTSEVKLVGLSVNCPDGVLGKYPHIMSILLAFDTTTVEIWRREYVLSCAETKEDSDRQEGALSLALLKAGYNIASMQRHYEGVDWRKWLVKYPNASFVSAPQYESLSACPGIMLDIFLKPNWYDGRTPHPYEFVFIKTNRGIYGNVADLDYLATEKSLPAPVKKHCLMLSHSSAADGAPIWMLRVAKIMISLGYELVFVTPDEGPTLDMFQSLGAMVIVDNLPLWDSPPHIFADWFRGLRFRLRIQNIKPAMAFFNTILYTRMVSSISPFLSDSCKFIWVIHEAEIQNKTMMMEPNFNYSFSHVFPELEAGPQVWSTVYVLWISDSTRAIVSKYDRGQFVTIRGFVEKCPNTTAEIVKAKAEARKVLGFTRKNIVVSNVGTICARKQQKWIIQFVRDLLRYRNNIIKRARFMLIGAGLNSSYSRYEDELKEDILHYNLSRYIRVYPRTKRPETFSVAADIHTSLSTHEGFPLNTIEMMCYGVPVIATPAFGTREQIIDSPRSGILLGSVSDYQEYSKNLLQLMNKSTAEMAEIGYSGKKLVEQYFTQQTALKSFKHLLQNLDRNDVSANRVCVVMRFYNRHLLEDYFSLENSIKSLLNQNHTDWELLLVPTDTTDITRVYPLLVKYNSRMNIRIIQHDDLQPFHEVNYVQFHRYVYALTDRVISHCSDDSSWLLVTNGDNTYDPRFFNYVDSRYDVIAYDFYSRWLNILSGRPPCEKLIQTDRNLLHSSCMNNTFRINNTDLGANVYNLRRWRREGLRYSDFTTVHVNQDGHMAEEVTRRNWTVRFVKMQETGFCLYDHNPNYHSCTRMSSTSVWEDSKHLCWNEKPPSTNESMLLPRCV